MPPRRRTDPAQGRSAVAAWRATCEAAASGPSAEDRTAATPPSRAALATAVRWSLEELAARYPGSTCEVRVPPFGVVQCLSGPRHTRGTPPNVVEADADTWLGLVTGLVAWPAAVASGRLRASGERADLSDLLPLD